MASRFPLRYDAVVKDLFQRDQPSVLRQQLGHRKVRGFLNVEFSIVEERITDLVIELNDGSILHIEFQSDNHPAMPYRMGMYGLLIADKYRDRKVEQIVIYLGSDPMRMDDGVSTGGIDVRYRLIDIREFRAADLLATGEPGDCALALLARGGVEQMHEILLSAQRLPEPERRRVFTQMAILSGLRGSAERFRMELTAMGVYIEIEDNVILKDIHDAGVAQGQTEGAANVLRGLLEDRFGPIPVWAESRIAGAGPSELTRWARRVYSAPDVESALERH